MDDPSGVSAAVPDDGTEEGDPVRTRRGDFPSHEAWQNDPARQARWAAWRAEHADAIASWNDYVEANGLPLAEYRLF